MAALAFEEAARRFPCEELQLSCNTLSGPASAAPHGDRAFRSEPGSSGAMWWLNIVDAALEWVGH